ncbi:phosphodiester glycosidase family protein [Longimicrobium sp.]|uniref:phosphodiester glycosidase family protein n=1 Tax=Longimicrobium sp. TaxID=2029185 RepID=UPI002ED969B2
MPRSSTRISILALTLALGSCRASPPERAEAATPADTSPSFAAEPSTAPAPPIETDSGGVQEMAFRGARYYVVPVDLDRARIQMHWEDVNGEPYRRASVLADSLSAAGERVIAVVNSGIYTPQDAPKGLHVERGRTLVPLNTTDSTSGNFFRPRPNGVFAVMNDGTARLVRRGAAAALVPRMREATQSGPRLLESGQPVSRFSNTPLRRTAICVASPRRVFIAVSRDPVSLNDLAALFRDRLGCTDALFLDGGAVQALVAPAEGIAMETGRFVGFIAVVAGGRPRSAAGSP